MSDPTQVEAVRHSLITGGLEGLSANFQYKVVHCPGKLHSNADALSGVPSFLEEMQ